MTHLQPSPLLRRALLLDAAASGATGLLMSLAAGWLTEWLGLPLELLLGAGVSLLPFALVLAWLSNRDTLQRGWIWAVIAVNALWVADSVLLLIGGWVAPTVLGYVFVIGQALVVALFAELEFFGLKRSQPALA